MRWVALVLYLEGLEEYWADENSQIILMHIETFINAIFIGIFHLYSFSE